MKKILAAASFDKQKYYLEKEFQGLPEEIQEEVRVICVLLAQKLQCTFVMGFYDDGEVYFESVREEDDFNFDEIGSELEIKQIYRTKSQLLDALKLWYCVYFTQEGEKIQQDLLRKTDAEN